MVSEFAELPSLNIIIAILICIVAQRQLLYSNPHVQFFAAFGFDYEVKISNNGPAVLGANITFIAELRKKDGKLPNEEYRYKWKDNLNPQHTGQV